MEKNLVDTNVLIELVKKGATEYNGYTTIFNILEFPMAVRITGLKVLYPLDEDYSSALKLTTNLLELGKPIPAIDILISAICINRDLTLTTMDKHFRYVLLVEKDFKLDLVEKSTQ